MYDILAERLRSYSENFVAYKLDANFASAVQEAADAIEELQSRVKVLEKVADKWCEAVPKWIPVTERLPEKNGSYLVYVYGEVTEMNCWHGKWHMLGNDYTKAVSHWMPLPQPPREET